MDRSLAPWTSFTSPICEPTVSDGALWRRRLPSRRICLCAMENIMAMPRYLLPIRDTTRHEHPSACNEKRCSFYQTVLRERRVRRTFRVSARKQRSEQHRRRRAEVDPAWSFVRCRRTWLTLRFILCDSFRFVYGRRGRCPPAGDISLFPVNHRYGDELIFLGHDEAHPAVGGLIASALG